DAAPAAGHPGPQVASDRSEHHDGAAGHVLAGVVARALDDRGGPRVPDREALAHPSRHEQLATGRPVQDHVSGQVRVTGIVAWREDHEATTAHALADVVVRLPDQPELGPGGPGG